MTPWIGVDFDRTLCTYGDDDYTVVKDIPTFGKPVPAMVNRVKAWLAQGQVVRVVTARVSSGAWDRKDQREAIYKWCLEHLGQVLTVTAEKDYSMVELWDDSVVRVERNTGRRLSPSFVEHD